MIPQTHPMYAVTVEFDSQATEYTAYGPYRVIGWKPLDSDTYTPVLVEMDGLVKAAYAAETDVEFRLFDTWGQATIGQHKAEKFCQRRTEQVRSRLAKAA